MNFKKFFGLVSEGRTRSERVGSFSSFKSISEGFMNRLSGSIIGDGLASFFNETLGGRRTSSGKEGYVRNGEIKAGLWSESISTLDYLEMIKEFKEQYPDISYVFLSLGLGDFYTSSEEIKKSVPEIKINLKRIFPNCSKFFIVPGSGWGYNVEDKASAPEWMWESGNIKNGPSSVEPPQINEYYTEVWNRNGFESIPVKIGIVKGDDGFSLPISKKTPGIEKFKDFVYDVLKGKIDVQREDIRKGQEIIGVSSETGLKEFYDILQNSINNDERKYKQDPSSYTYDPVVERAQIGLKFLGFELPVYGADGLFGPETEESVKGFRQKYEVEGESTVIDPAFLSALIARLREGGFDKKDVGEIISVGSGADTGSDIVVGDTNLGSGETSWVYWLSHNQGSAGASELLKVALGTKPEFSSNGKKWFMKGWNNKTNHIVGNVGNRGWDGEYKNRIKAAYDQGNDQLVAKLFTEFQKKKFDQMLERGRKDLPKHPDIEAILQKYSNVFPLDFLAAVASQESAFNPKAGNNRYKGLFALDPTSGYGKKYGLTQANVHDPEKNTEVAVKFWNDNRKEFHSLMSSNELAALGLSKTENNMA